MDNQIAPSFCMDRTLQTLMYCGVQYKAQKIQQLLEDDHLLFTPFEKELFAFLASWFAPSDELEVHTSGSTGTPKRILVSKEKMMQSARLTCLALNLHEGDNALLCMPLRYIAGKMVVVRALVAGLNLYVATPSSHPLATIEVPLRFAAMVPLQVYHSLLVAQETNRLREVENLIIGGGAIDAAMANQLKDFPHAVYSTYGMTETLSHIALRRLNGKDASLHYQPFQSVHISLSEAHTLVIDAPLVCNEPLTTNDVAELFPDGTFTIIGRSDNIINTGGIKIQTEVVEEKLRNHLATPFAITSVSDERLGQAVTLLIEGSKDRLCQPIKFEEILTKYEQPKHIFFVSHLPQTETGKIDRAACKHMANLLLHH